MRKTIITPLWHLPIKATLRKPLFPGLSARFVQSSDEIHRFCGLR